MLDSTDTLTPVTSWISANDVLSTGLPTSLSFPSQWLAPRAPRGPRGYPSSEPTPPPRHQVWCGWLTSADPHEVPDCPTSTTCSHEATASWAKVSTPGPSLPSRPVPAARTSVPASATPAPAG